VKNDVHLNSVSNFSSHLTENTDQPVSDFQGNNRYLF